MPFGVWAAGMCACERLASGCALEDEEEGVGDAHFGPAESLAAYEALTFGFPVYVPASIGFHEPFEGHACDAVVGVGEDGVDVCGEGEGDGGHHCVGFVPLV